MPAKPRTWNIFDVRYAPESDRLLRCREMTKRANSVILRRSKQSNRIASFDHLAAKSETQFIDACLMF
jgi:hypothetical protein